MKKTLFFFLLAAAGGMVFFTAYFPALSRYQELKFQEQEIDRKMKLLDEKIRDLSEERELLQKDPEYLERVIRNELGLVKPGEIVYKFVEEPVAVAATAAAAIPPMPEHEEGVAGVVEAKVQPQAVPPPTASSAGPAAGPAKLKTA